MSLGQHLIHNQAGSVAIELNTRPTTATVSILTNEGSALVTNASATITSISTTLNGAVSAGATTFVVTNASNITSGTELWIRTPDEKTRCKTVSGTTVTPYAPLLQAHATGVTCESTRLTYSVAAADNDTLFFDGRVQWVLDGEIAHYQSIECTKYPLARLCQTTDLYDLDPCFSRILEIEADHESQLDIAHNDILARIGAKARVRVYPGSTEFVRATAFMFAANHFGAIATDSAERMYERYMERAEAEISRVTALVPRDEDQDGVANEPHERISARTVPLGRG